MTGTRYPPAGTAAALLQELSDLGVRERRGSPRREPPPGPPPPPPAAAPPRDAERGARHAAEHGHGEARAEHAARRRALRHRRAAPGGGVRGGRRRGHAGPAQAASTSSSSPSLPLLRGIGALLLPARRRRRLGVHALALGWLLAFPPCLALRLASLPVRAIRVGEEAWGVVAFVGRREVEGE